MFYGVVGDRLRNKRSTGNQIIAMIKEQESGALQSQVSSIEI